MKTEEWSVNSNVGSLTNKTSKTTRYAELNMTLAGNQTLVLSVKAQSHSTQPFFLQNSNVLQYVKHFAHPVNISKERSIHLLDSIIEHVETKLKEQPAREKGATSKKPKSTKDPHPKAQQSTGNAELDDLFVNANLIVSAHSDWAYTAHRLHG